MRPPWLPPRAFPADRSVLLNTLQIQISTSSPEIRAPPWTARSISSDSSPAPLRQSRLLQRYLTGSQRALLKNLELLDRIQLQLPSTKQPAVRKGPEGDLAGGWRKPLKNVGVNGRTYTPRPKSSRPAKPASNDSEPPGTDIAPLDVSGEVLGDQEDKD